MLKSSDFFLNVLWLVVEFLDLAPAVMSETNMGLSHFPKSTKSAVYMRHFAWLLCGIKGNITHYYVNHENFD